MKVQNIGIDIVEVKRFRKIPYKKGSVFYSKIFSDAEIKYCLSKTDPAQHFAARFAAKEAVLKCLRSTIYKVKEIEIVNDKNGAPLVMVHSHRSSSGKFLVSLSHTHDYAVATALFVN